MAGAISDAAVSSASRTGLRRGSRVVSCSSIARIERCSAAAPNSE
jgi:hypothetical protein